DWLKDTWAQEYMFSYEIQVPLADRDSIRTLMLSDLNRWFKRKFNIMGVSETRILPVWVLTVENETLFKKSSAVKRYFQEECEYSWINYPAPIIFKMIGKEIEGIGDAIFLDETGLSSDITLDM